MTQNIPEQLRKFDLTRERERENKICKEEDKK